MKIGMISLGCCKNLVDSENIMGVLQASNHEIVHNPSEAEAIIINTCGFIEPAKEEAINTILEMAEYKQFNCKKLIVTGCLAQRYKDSLIEELPEVDCFITIDEYKNLGNILTEVLGQKVSNTYGKAPRLMATKPWMGYLKIADGCDNRCTYCAIPLIRGGYRSIPKEQLVEEAKQMALNGVKELVCIAQDTTRYGTDNYKSRELLSLLEEFNKIEGLHWIRVLYMYPDEIDDELVVGMKKLDKVLPYFDIPVQYGNDHMLKLMNRRGSVESIYHTIDLIRKTYDMPVLRTTIIVGFPHETEETFNDTLEFVKKCKWDRLGAFTYSKEEDTVAYDMDEEVDEEVKENRLARLMMLQNEISNEINQKLVGQILEVLVENFDGLTERYLGRSIHSAPDGIDGTVFFKADENLKFGTFVNVKITRAKDHNLYGEMI